MTPADTTGSVVVTYLVLAHTDPAGLIRLIRRIRALSPSSGVLVRYDVPGLADPEALKTAGAHEVLVSDIAVTWGSWEQTESIVEALRVARRSVPGDYYVIVSGQDYPVRNLRRWEAEINANGADAFVARIVDHPDDYEYRWRIVRKPRLRPPFLDRAAGHALWRVGQLTHRWLQIYQGPHERFDGRFWVGLRRHHPGPVVPTKGATWMTLSARAVDRVLDIDEGRPDLRGFFVRVRNSDESYLQTLLTLAPGLRIEERPTSTFTMPEGRSNAEWLDEARMRRAVEVGAPFARKVPPGVDEAVLAVADAAVERERDPAQPGTGTGTGRP